MAEGTNIDSCDELVKQALEIQGALLGLIVSRDIKAELKGKIRDEIERFTRLVLRQSCEIARLKGVNEGLKHKRTFSEVVSTDKKQVKQLTPRGRSRSRSRQRREHIVLVKPNDESIGSEETVKKVKDLINPKTLEVTINQVRSIQKGGIIINTSSEEDSEKILEELNKIEEFQKDHQVQKPRGRYPHIVLFDVDENLPKEELTRQLLENNEELTEGSFEVKFNYKSRRGRNWVVEVTPDSFNKLHLQRIKLSWRIVNYKEYLRPTLCFKCGRFGHISKFCRGIGNCLDCGEVGHERRSCDREYKRCINCVTYNQKFKTSFNTEHSAVDKKCEVWGKEVNRLIYKTNYG